MNPKIGVGLQTPPLETFSSSALAIAVVGPDSTLRSEVLDALAGCHSGKVTDFSSYPPTIEELPRLLGDFDIILIEWDSNPEYALDLVEGVCAAGRATVMIYSKETDPELTDSDLLMRCMRAGAREFLGKPFSHATMAEALVRAVARRPASRDARQTGGRLFVFCGAKGGAGVTAIASNFALALVHESSQSALFVDLDLPLGDAALNLGVTPQYSTIDALNNSTRLDSSFLSQLLVKHPSGISVLAAPGSYTECLVTDEAVRRLLQVARQSFENVVVDVGSKLDLTGNIDTFRDATTIYLVTQAGVPELRNANRLIAKYFRSGSPNLEIVLNRFEPRSTRVSEDDIRKALSRPAKWKIPSDYASMRRMQDTATPVVSTDSAVARELGLMARAACGLPESTEKKKGFSFRSLISSKPSPSDDALTISPDHTGSADNTDISAQIEKFLDPVSIGGVSKSSTLRDEPETRIYNGNVYGKGNDGQWYVKQPLKVEGANEIPVISWDEPEPITYGTPLSSTQFNATASVPGTFAYVPPKGFLLPAGKHTLWGTFTPHTDDGNAIQASAYISVLKATPSVSWPKPHAISCGHPLGPDQLNATASVPGQFEYDPPQGTVLPEGLQTILASFTPSDTANYNTALAEMQIVVVREKPTVTWLAPPSITYGRPLSGDQLNARASVPGTFVYNPAQGTVLPVGQHKITASFTPTEITNYTAAEADVMISVVKAKPTVAWPAPPALTYGTPLTTGQLNAGASVPGDFAYTPGEGAMLAAGLHCPSTLFTPSDTANYAEAQTTTTLTVAKATPVVTWPAPEDLPYGRELSSDQLNATASVPGTFTYDPCLGAMLPEGPQSLRVTFTPDDEVNFAEVEAGVQLNITAAPPVPLAWAAPSPVAYGTPLGLVQLNATAPVEGAFTYTPSVGTVLPAGEHALSVVFTPADPNLPAAMGTVTLTVSKAEPVITWLPPEDILYGVPLGSAQLNAAASVPGVLHYAPAEGHILDVGVRALSVAFTPDDSENYASAEASVNLRVLPATPHLTWPEPSPISYGTPLDASQLNAEASLPGSFVYAPPQGTVLPTGSHRLAAIFIPEDSANHARARSSVTLLVTERPDVERIILPSPPDEEKEAPAKSEKLHPVIPIRSVETKTDPWKPLVARPLANPSQPLPAVTHDATDSKPMIPLNGKPLGAVVDAETRTYRGQIYRKGADGQWHLQQS